MIITDYYCLNTREIICKISRIRLLHTHIYKKIFVFKPFKKLDENNVALLSLDVNEGLNDILNQFGNSNYGKVKYTKNTLFWIGYMYRYIAYTRGESTKFVMSLFS